MREEARTALHRLQTKRRARPRAKARRVERFAIV